MACLDFILGLLKHEEVILFTVTIITSHGKLNGCFKTCLHLDIHIICWEHAWWNRLSTEKESKEKYFFKDSVYVFLWKIAFPITFGPFNTVSTV